VYGILLEIEIGGYAKGDGWLSKGDRCHRLIKRDYWLCKDGYGLLIK